MILLPEAEAAYQNVIAFNAQPADLDLLVAAAQQGDMPLLITNLGTAIQTVQNTYDVYTANPTSPNLLAWDAASASLRTFIMEHSGLPAQG